MPSYWELHRLFSMTMNWSCAAWYLHCCWTGHHNIIFVLCSGSPCPEQASCSHLTLQLSLSQFNTSLKTFLLLPAVSYSNPLIGTGCCTFCLFCSFAADGFSGWLMTLGGDREGERGKREAVSLGICVDVGAVSYTHLTLPTSGRV